jgi:hypothetical protein
MSGQAETGWGVADSSIADTSGSTAATDSLALRKDLAMRKDASGSMGAKKRRRP